MLSLASLQFTAPARPAAARHRGRQARGVAVFAGDLSPEQQKAALERQLKKSSNAKQQPAAPASAAAPSEQPQHLEADLVTRQREARAWITPWLQARAAEQSREAQAALRERVSLISSDAEQRALKRLLYGGSGSFSEEEAAAAPAAAAGAKEAVAEKAAAAPAARRWEPQPDGSVLFTAEMLAGVSFEDILSA